jgi:ATP-binding cassette subfamily B protein
VGKYRPKELYCNNAGMDDGLNREVSRDIGQLRAALAYLRPYWRQVAIASVALIVTAGVTLSVGQGVRLLIDEGLSNGSARLLVQSIAVFGALILLLTAGTFVRFYYVSWIGERVSADLRTAVFNHLINLHPGFFESNLPTEIQSRITTDTTLLQTVIGSSVSIALRNMLMFVGGVVLLFVTNPKLSMIVLLAVPLVVLPIVGFGRRVRALSRSSQDRLAEVGSHAGESLRHIKVVQAFNHQPLDAAAFDGRVERAFAVAIHRIRQRAWLIAVVMLLVMSAIGLMLWIGGQDVIAGRTTAGELAAFIFYAIIVAGSVGAISEVYSDLQRAAGATERLVELLESRSVLAEPEVALARPDVVGGDVVVRFDGVSFAYPSRPQVQVLDEVTFDVARGDMVALVGPSGAGKSTLFDLAQRFYDPSEGRVLLAGVDLRALATSDVRAAMGYVPQDPVLFAGTLRDNVCYGRPDASEAELIDALEAAHAIAFVDALPDRLETRVGEGGAGLSGGQRQRIAIARALVTSPALLLLDEATASLDAESEQHIRASIENLKGRCCILVIAHRLSTVRQADRIVVLDAGRVIGEGSHDELVRSNALYARFAAIQFEGLAPNGVPAVEIAPASAIQSRVHPR